MLYGVYCFSGDSASLAPKHELEIFPWDQKIMIEGKNIRQLGFASGHPPDY